MKYLSLITTIATTSSLLFSITVSKNAAAAETDDTSVSLGADGGAVYRTGSPALGLGAAWGLHLDLNTSKMFSVGAYYLDSYLPVTCFPDNARDARFQALGARVRFVLPIPESKVHPFGTLGVGATFATYPAEAMYNDIQMGGAGALLIDRSGGFIEIPLGIGVGYDITDSVELGGEVNVRPGFGFWGDAYNGDLPADPSRVGLAGLVSLSFRL